MKRLCTLLGLIALLSACSLAPPQRSRAVSIVGKWKESEGNATYEFRSDGTVHLGRQSIVEARGVYHWLDGELLSMEFGTPKILIGGTVHAKFTPKRMTLVSPDGERSTFQRVD